MVFAIFSNSCQLQLRGMVITVTIYVMIVCIALLKVIVIMQIVCEQR